MMEIGGISSGKQQLQYHVKTSFNPHGTHWSSRINNSLQKERRSLTFFFKENIQPVFFPKRFHAMVKLTDVHKTNCFEKSVQCVENV